MHIFLLEKVMSRINPREFIKSLSEDRQRLFNDLVFALAQQGRIKTTEAEEIALTKFIEMEKIRINYSAMSSMARYSLVNKWALSILDELYNKNVKHEELLLSCMKCGSKTSTNSFWGYCTKCNDEFDTAIQNGAIILYNGSFQADSNNWEIKRYLSGEVAFSKNYNFNQLQAILEARRIAKRKGIDKIVFEYLPHHSRWFLDEYLEAHPNLKKDVLNSERGILSWFKRIFT